MNRIARAAMALVALSIPIASIVVVEAGVSSGTVVADRWCC
jgi:hypothetical protein